MPLTAGARLGPYEVTGPLGAGGMGEVYRARDTRLDRTVAIKVLPGVLGGDPVFRERFDREARTISALNHPNICTLLDVGDREGAPFLVMECVDGPTLADRLSEGPLPQVEAIQVAMQIASALDAAHAKGIVHRDLKPGNVMLTKTGAKVLDFGLAKEFGSQALENSPTFTVASATAAGTILGTAAYMSPEQARGLPLDARSDVWAFGAVLFEMLSGAQAFAGATATDILAAIIRGEPDWGTLPAGTPPALVSLLRRCLRKDPAKRLHAIADAAIELEEIATAPPASRAAPVPPRSRLATLLPWGIAVAAVALAAFPRIASPPAPVAALGAIKVEINGPPDVELFSSIGQSVAISPDGRRVAFVGIHGGVRRVYLRRLDEFEPTPLKGTENVLTVFFSPDGNRLGFVGSDRALRTVSLAEGTVSLITRAVDYWGATWLPDDTIVAATQSGLVRVAAAGGTPEPLTRGGDAERVASPERVPGQHAVLFTAISAQTNQPRLEAISLVDGRRHVVAEGASSALVLPGGRLLFARGGEAVVAPFDASAQKLTGPARRAGEEIVVRSTGAMFASASAAGDLAFIPRSIVDGQLVSVSRSGAERPLNDTPRTYANPRLSPDGRRLVVEDRGGELWIQDLLRGSFTPLTSSDTFLNTYPVWSRDGRIVYRTAYDMRVADPDSGEPGRPIDASGIDDFPADVTPDGAQLAFVRLTAERSGDILLRPFTGGASRALLQTAAYEGGLRFSPDGRWYVYSTNESGRSEVFIRRVGGEGRWPVSTDGGTQPVWTAGSNEIFYRNGPKMMVVKVTLGATPVLSDPQMVFERPYAYGANISIPNYDVSADGQRLIMVRQPAGARVHLVLAGAGAVR
ncbi:MAG TPA: protein kinase [Vicinamibacterales bacterium]|nr:protein kinase [Vicinamibacterales bacterium]